MLNLGTKVVVSEVAADLDDRGAQELSRDSLPQRGHRPDAAERVENGSQSGTQPLLVDEVAARRVQRVPHPYPVRVAVSVFGDLFGPFDSERRGEIRGLRREFVGLALPVSRQEEIAATSSDLQRQSAADSRSWQLTGPASANRGEASQRKPAHRRHA